MQAGHKFKIKVMMMVGFKSKVMTMTNNDFFVDLLFVN